MAPRLTSPADIARVALKRLAELGLSPTPENYARFYHDIAGVSQVVAGGASQQADSDLVASVHEVVAGAAEATGSLADLIHDHNQDFQSSLSGLRQTDEKADIMRILGSIISTASSMHETVEDSHSSLSQLRGTLEQMQEDMAASRHALERDPLTGTQNRQGLDFLLAKEVTRAHRHQSKLTLALLDLDDFKLVNDRYGHTVGDKVLIHVTNITKAVLRTSDTLVRYGGEEFLILLPETDVNGAKFLMERLRQVFRNNPVMHEGRRIDVSFSAGIAQLAAEENGHALILRADQAMYAAKAGGRNAIIVAADRTIQAG
ncbi:GGDEF domain-containing protein [Chitinivorax sp. PXF-14]|uniref:GGDEF domain-containing protein n=1 Tax=Chitinivorax sp. PXF-14 TaxID=3230488 RepID=UPI003465E083